MNKNNEITRMALCVDSWAILVDIVVSFIICLCTTSSLFFCLLFLLTMFQYHILRSELKHNMSPAIFF